MAAVGIAQAAGGVVVFGEEEGGECAGGSVVARELVDGAKEALGLVKGDGALAAQIGLKIGHQEGSGDAFSGDVADDETDAVAAEIEEVVIIATDFAGLDAQASIFEGFEWRLRLGKETSLDLLGNFDFLRGAAFGFQPPGEGAALRFDGVGYLIEADQRKGIAVGILEARKDAAPNRSGLCAGRGGVHRLRSAHLHLILEAFEAWREVEANSVLGPFAVLGNHIFGDEGDRGGPANELALFRAGLRRDESEVRGAVGRGDGYETTVGLNAGGKDQLEAELIEVEAQAQLEIANVNRNRLEAQVGILAIQANSGAVRPFARGVGHRWDYKVERGHSEHARNCPQQERKKADSSGKLRPRNDKSVGFSATRRRKRSMLRHYKVTCCQAGAQPAAAGATTNAAA